MARLARCEVIDPAEVQVVHCVSRCVRRAFLCGFDQLTGKSFEHRRGWIRQRLEFLAGVFGIDCLTYSVMNNHVHLILRSRPDVVASWSDEEVATRWLRLFPNRHNPDGSPAIASQAEIDSIVTQPDVLSDRRSRLSDLSWWMRCLAENIARRSNREDQVTGHFWEGRFRAVVLLDEASLLACAAYVDLNPVRAALAETPEQSKYTGAKDRIDDLQRDPKPTRISMHQWERERSHRHSGWLSPLQMSEATDPGDGAAEPGQRRASGKGFLSLSLESYLELLDWTGRQLRSDKPGAIPAQFAPILQRIGIAPGQWCQLVRGFSRCFKRAAGTAASLRAEAARRGQRWLQAPGNPLAVAC